MFTEKEFKNNIFFLIGGHPYAWAKNNGIKRGVIDQLKREKIPGAKILNILSLALKKDVDTLLGKKPDKSTKDYDIEHREKAGSVKESEINLTREGKDMDVKRSVPGLDVLTEEEYSELLRVAMKMVSKRAQLIAEANEKTESKKNQNSA